MSEEPWPSRGVITLLDGRRLRPVPAPAWNPSGAQWWQGGGLRMAAQIEDVPGEGLARHASLSRRDRPPTRADLAAVAEAIFPPGRVEATPGVTTPRVWHLWMPVADAPDAALDTPPGAPGSPRRDEG